MGMNPKQDPKPETENLESCCFLPPCQADVLRSLGGLNPKPTGETVDGDKTPPTFIPPKAN